MVVVVSDTITMTGLGQIDSFDSGTDLTIGNDAVVATAHTGAGKIDLRNSSRIQGDAYCGLGGDPAVAIAVGSYAAISGETATLPAAVEMPGISTPVIASPSLGSVVYSTGDHITLTADTHYSDVRLAGSGRLTIDGDVTIVCDGTFRADNYSVVEITPGSSLSLYVGGHFLVAGYSKINADGGEPSRMRVYIESGTGTVQNASELFAHVQCPGGLFKVSGIADCWGTLIGDSLRVQNTGAFHTDLADGVMQGLGGPRVIALYEFDQVLVDPVLIGHWRLNESVSGGIGGVASSGRIELKGSSSIDSYNSSQGDYGPSNSGSNAYVATNSTLGARIKKGTIYGDAYAGPGGNPNSVISSSVTGIKSALTQAIPMPSYGSPGGSFTNMGSRDYTSNTTWSANLRFEDLVIKDEAVITISGDVTIHASKKFEVDNEAEIRLLPGASLTIYVGEDLIIKNESQVGRSSDASQVRFIQYGSGKKS